MFLFCKVFSETEYLFRSLMVIVDILLALVLILCNYLGNSVSSGEEDICGMEGVPTGKTQNSFPTRQPRIILRMRKAWRIWPGS